MAVRQVGKWQCRADYSGVCCGCVNGRGSGGCFGVGWFTRLRDCSAPPPCRKLIVRMVFEKFFHFFFFFVEFLF